MTGTLYASCAQVLSVCQGVDDLNTLLSPHTGFAPRLRQLCAEQYVPLVNVYRICVTLISLFRLVDLEERDLGEVSPSEIEALRLESETWALLQAIMP